MKSSIQIRYHGLGGCMTIIIFLLSFGIANLAIWWTMRRWPRSADAQGVSLRNGKRYAWAEIRRVEHRITNVNGTKARKYIFYLDKGKWELAYERLRDPQAVMEFFRRHLPEHL